MQIFEAVHVLNNRWRSSGAACLLLAALIQGCGGGSSSASDGAAPPPDPITLSTVSWSLVAGSLSGQGALDGAATVAHFNSPRGVVIDSAGAVLVADRGNHALRKIATDGSVTTLAGKMGESGHTDGAAGAARLSSPSGVTRDARGNIYVADTGNGAIRMLDPAGQVSTVATGLQLPTSVAVDGPGNLYAITHDGVYRRASDGTVGLFAGLANKAAFSSPRVGTIWATHFTGVAVDSLGQVVVAGFIEGDDAGGTLLRFDSQGRVLGWGSLAGDAVRGLNANLLTADDAGNIFALAGAAAAPNAMPVSVLKIGQAGAVSTVAVIAMPGVAGFVDGPAAAARFSVTLGGLAVAPGGALLVSDTDNHAIRRMDVAGAVSTIAGGVGGGHIDGPGRAARFGTLLRRIAAGAEGALYVDDYLNSSLRRIGPDATVSTVQRTLGGQAHDFIPLDSMVGVDGTLYLGEAVGDRVDFWAMAPDGALRLARSASYGMVSRHFTVDKAGNFYLHGAFAESGGLKVISPDGRERVLASAFGAWKLNVDAAGMLYFISSSVVATMDPQGQVRILAGDPVETGHRDGLGPQARFAFLAPATGTLDAAGNFYVVDGDGSIRKISPQGEVTTLAVVSGEAGYPSNWFTSPPSDLQWHADALYATYAHAVIRFAPVPATGGGR